VGEMRVGGYSGLGVYGETELVPLNSGRLGGSVAKNESLEVLNIEYRLTIND